MRIRAALAFAGLMAAGTLGPAGAARGEPLPADSCKVSPGTSQPATNWALQRLDVARTSSLTQGRDVRTGQPVRVAVIDSGLDLRHPQMRGIDAAGLQDAIPNDPGRRYDDCAGHGTQVTALIAAQHSAAVPGFFGVAPQVRIIPIKVVNTTQETVASANVARAIDLAVAAHAQIANVSISIGDDPAVRAAVARARRAGMLIVAAAGNEKQLANQVQQYPARYSTSYDNVVAVGATQQNDTVADFSDTGPYLDVAAPGKGVQSIGVRGGYLVLDGTSFATPYVTGTAALVLAANPGLTPKQLRDRLESTADTPPESTPSRRYGYGIVDPYLAMTAVGDDGDRSQASTTPAALRLGVAPPAPDRTLQHVALGVGFGLLGLAALVLTAAAVLRGRRRVGPRRG